MSIPRIPERFLTGEVTLKDFLAFLSSIHPKSDLSISEYMILCEWVEKLAKALDIPEGEEQP